MKIFISADYDSYDVYIIAWFWSGVCVSVCVCVYLNSCMLEKESQENKIAGGMCRPDYQNEPEEFLGHLCFP